MAAIIRIAAVCCMLYSAAFALQCYKYDSFTATARTSVNCTLTNEDTCVLATVDKEVNKTTVHGYVQQCGTLANTADCQSVQCPIVTATASNFFNCTATCCKTDNCNKKSGAGITSAGFMFSIAVALTSIAFAHWQ